MKKFIMTVLLATVLVFGMANSGERDYVNDPNPRPTHWHLYLSSDCNGGSYYGKTNDLQTAINLYNDGIIFGTRATYYGNYLPCNAGIPGFPLESETNEIE